MLQVDGFNYADGVADKDSDDEEDESSTNWGSGGIVRGSVELEVLRGTLSINRLRRSCSDVRERIDFSKGESIGHASTECHLSAASQRIL